MIDKLDVFKNNQTINKLSVLDQAILLFEIQNKYVSDLGSNDCNIIASFLKELKELREQNSIYQRTINALMGQIQEMENQIPKRHLVANNDFPTNEDNRFYLCISENHEQDLPTMFQYESELGFGWWNDIYDEHTLGFVDSEFITVEEEHLEKVIAWMELPKFSEVE